eukprot:14096509-Alexandrium_andersonii.AAC.1
MRTRRARARAGASAGTVAVGSVDCRVSRSAPSGKAASQMADSRGAGLLALGANIGGCTKRRLCQ